MEPPIVEFHLLSTTFSYHRSIVSDIHWLPKDFQVTYTFSKITLHSLNMQYIHIYNVFSNACTFEQPLTKITLYK